MKKTVLILLMTAALMIACISCGDQKNTDKGNGDATTSFEVSTQAQSSVTTATETTEETTDDGAVVRPPIPF